MRTSELTGAALDWAVAIAEGFKPSQLYVCSWSKSIYTRTFDDDGNPDGYMTGPDRLYSRKWEAGGPIIERTFANVFFDVKDASYAGHRNEPWFCEMDEIGGMWHGPTPLVAAMRCYVAFKLGDEVEIPKELT
jgi:hypothetical protein